MLLELDFHVPLNEVIIIITIIIIIIIIIYYYCFKFGGSHSDLEHVFSNLSDVCLLFIGEEVRARARFWRDQSLLDRANAMPLKSCDALERIAGGG